MAYETVLELDARSIGELVAAIGAGSPASASAYRRARSEIQFDGRREFYSYGRHFPLARYVPARRRAPAVWIVNGDTWRGARGWNGSRTPNHQQVTREAIETAGDASIVLPFSALAGAGIEFDTVRPIQVRPDANWTEYDELPDAVDIDALETATTREEFDYGANSAAGVRYEWRDVDGRRYSRTLYRRSHVAGEWRNADAERFEADPIGAAVNSIAYLGGTREIVRRGDEWRAARHVHRLGDSLFSSERVDPRTGERFRRAVYLSSFDYNEPAPLYFLAEIPRGAGAVTVDAALDALAPRAVHAAYARGVDVRRQGDIFFIGTRQTRESLAAAGATFARLTQWTRDAAPRAGEIGYRARLSAAGRRRLAERERRARVREFRERFRAASDRASAGYTTGRDAETEAERAARRAATRKRFAALFARHETERDACRLAGVDTEAPESIACNTCGATIGEPCRPFEALPEDLPETLRRRIETERERNAVMDSAGDVVAGFHMARRSTIATRQRTELSELRRETATRSATSSRPETGANARRRYAAKRREAETAVASARESLRRAIFAEGSTVRYSSHGGPTWRETETDYRRRVRVSNVAQCRTNLARALAEAEARRHARGAERDGYRRFYGNNASACLVTARHNARARYRPETVDGADEWRRRRERVRQGCAIYGTAHSATELARTRDGRVYVRGIVRHVPDLETGRAGGRDHRPIALPAEVWYLAIRNTVPRQRRRRRRSVSA